MSTTNDTSSFPTSESVTMATEKPSWLPDFTAGPIVLIVLACLCAILGTIYAYIYYTRINPRSGPVKRYVEPPVQEEDPENKITHTHLFLFKKKSNTAFQ